ncbi:MAG TPA: ABC transporter ATP-binding protein [Acidimicrobiales bacterium]|nr:ABC transporter ATP-binding protein [Acidimicrobiales bacterium]
MGGLHTLEPRRTEEGTRTGALLLRDVHHAYERAGERIQVLAGADLEVQSGELVAIVGRSGSGKSTLLHVAGGLVTPAQGEVHVGGELLNGAGPTARAAVRRRSIGFVFQFFHLLAHLNVRDNVALPLLLDGADVRHARRRADVALDDVGLGDRSDHLPSELSGGQLQRAAIARALVTEPAVVLADEPTGNLDATTAGDVLDLLVSQVRDRGAALVLVTHDGAAAARADRTLHLLDGLLV